MLLKKRLFRQKYPGNKPVWFIHLKQIYSNVALFGMTAQEWRSENPAAKGNIRDAATLEQLVVLSNIESINQSLFVRV